jgi:outer membrane murein-binding lipoprotein Lpp
LLQVRGDTSYTIQEFFEEKTMKKQNVKMWTTAAMITLLILAGCAGKDDMGMDEIKKDTMKSAMKTDSAMKKMDSMADDMSHKEMKTDMVKEMPEKVESTMMEEMDSMKKEMDESMESGMKKKQ